MRFLMSSSVDQSVVTRSGPNRAMAISRWLGAVSPTVPGPKGHRRTVRPWFPPEERGQQSVDPVEGFELTEHTQSDIEVHEPREVVGQSDRTAQHAPFPHFDPDGPNTFADDDLLPSAAETPDGRPARQSVQSEGVAIGRRDGRGAHGQDGRVEIGAPEDRRWRPAPAEIASPQISGPSSAWVSITRRVGERRISRVPTSGRMRPASSGRRGSASQVHPTRSSSSIRS